MTPTSSPTTQFTLALTEEEHAQLLNWLEQRLQNKRLEEHRTDASEYRQYVVHEEALVESLIKKLRRT